MTEPEAGLASENKSARFRRLHPERDAEFHRKWASKNPGAKRAAALRKRYGLTVADFDRMVEEQGGLCRICLGTRKLVVDHDHETGRVRGLLCIPCNSQLGWLERHGDAARRYLDG